jgi:oligopeptide transport system ATP-binding protein
MDAVGRGDNPLLRVRNLRVYYPIESKTLIRRTVGHVHAVDDVSFDIHQGETLGLVGESGCGKTTTGRTVLLLRRPTSGTVEFMGQDLAAMGTDDLRRMRRHMQLIFQDPYSSLDPRMTVGEIVGEALDIHRLAPDRNARTGRILELLAHVGLSPRAATRYPHEFSGGQRQRVGIARALAVQPAFVVCDEPVSALDVSIQAQVVNLLRRLQREMGLTYLFISHDLAVIRSISDRIAVMYLGKIVETGPADEVYFRPLHPYTAALLSAVPTADPAVERLRQRIVLHGDPPSPAAPPPGCRFHTRCPFAQDRCRTEVPELEDAGDGHLVACHFYREIRSLVQAVEVHPDEESVTR